jgi:ABC-type branched-subunit amino acid transport system ATPase component
MRLTRIGAHDFLAFHELSLTELSPTLSVIVGPNGAGKSSLRRTLDLLVRAVQWSAASDSRGWERVRGYTGAVRRGADTPRYWVRVGLELTEPDERELVVKWLRFAVLCTALRSQPHQVSPEAVDAHLLERVDQAETAPLFEGALVVLYEASPYERFSVGYEFQYEGDTFCLIFRGTGPPGIVRGELESLRPWPTGESTPSIQMLFADATAPTEPNAQSELSFSFKHLLPPPGELTQLTVNPNQVFQETQVFQQGMRALALDTSQHRVYSLDVVFVRLLDRVVLLADQRNGPRHLYRAEELFTSSWAAHEEDLPLELSRLKLGDHDEQRRFQEIEHRFRILTGVDFELRMQGIPAPAGQGDASNESWFEIGVDVPDGPHAIPLELSGAGRWEALILSAALASGPEQVVVFDEPATSLHPSLQRTLLGEIQNSHAQSLLITHSPFLVPAGAREDLHRIIRIDRKGNRTTVHRLPPPADATDPRRIDKSGAKLQQLIAGSSDARSLLFARAVILLEGESDFGALEQWLANGSSTGEPTPHQLNVVLVDVGGDAGFGRFAAYLDVFGIPWVILCDGPGLNPRHAHSLCGQIDRALPELQPPDPEDFPAWRDYWTKHGVYTLAENFNEEIEQPLERVDPEAWQTANDKFPKSKIRAARAFAEDTKPPAGVVEVYRLALNYLGLRAILLDPGRDSVVG